MDDIISGLLERLDDERARHNAVVKLGLMLEVNTFHIISPQNDHLQKFGFDDGLVGREMTLDDQQAICSRL